METNNNIKFVSQLDNDIGKAVQLYVKEKPVLAIGDVYNLYHGDILDKVLEEMGVPYEKTATRDGRFHAKKRGDSYIAVGMGDADLFEMDEGRIYLLEKSNSLGYGLNINQEHARRLNEHLNGVKVKID